jgi:hypothetical protein
MVDRKLASAVPPIRGNNQLMLIVVGGRIKERGTIVGDRMTENGRGGGDLVETFELHKITSLPYFQALWSSERTRTYFTCVLDVRLRCQRHGQLVFRAKSEGLLTGQVNLFILII